MSKRDYLHVHISLAIANDQEPKKNAADYPGYWLLVASEYLKPASYKRLLADLNLDERDLSAYRFALTMDVYSLLQQQEDQQA